MMEEKTYKTGSPSVEHSYLLGALCLLLGGFSLLSLPVMLLFSLGPLVTTRGRAWEYDPVRELFIMSLIVFAVLVVLPLVAAYGLLRKRRWVKAPVVMVGTVSLLVGSILIASSGLYETIAFSGPCVALGIYAFCVLYRGALSQN